MDTITKGVCKIEFTNYNGSFYMHVLDKDLLPMLSEIETFTGKMVDARTSEPMCIIEEIAKKLHLDLPEKQHN